MNEQVTEYINNAPQNQKEIMEILRKLIHENGRNVREEFKWSRPIFKSDKDFSYFQVNKNHLNFGFYNGVELLNDPDGILQGTGKTMRHIKLKSTSDINLKLLAEWIKILTKKTIK